MNGRESRPLWMYGFDKYSYLSGNISVEIHCLLKIYTLTID
jgi:hypothetical protein